MLNIIKNRPLLLAFAAGLLASLVSTPASAEETFVPICEERSAVIAGLASEYAEEPVSMGFTAQGTIIEILASSAGDWTMIETSTDGTSCLVANGQMWRETDETLKTSAIAGTMFY